ncbi:hypothetical protein GA0070615_6299 [Micromonospora aurantiaca]|nr:hypothetical protein GA0070615_6299 [Micromonospora aurantiaca]
MPVSRLRIGGGEGISEAVQGRRRVVGSEGGRGTGSRRRCRSVQTPSALQRVQDQNRSDDDRHRDSAVAAHRTSRTVPRHQRRLRHSTAAAVVRVRVPVLPRMLISRSANHCVTTSRSKVPWATRRRGLHRAVVAGPPCSGGYHRLRPDSPSSSAADFLSDSTMKILRRNVGVSDHQSDDPADPMTRWLNSQPHAGAQPRVRRQGGLRFAFYGRMSTIEHQDRVTSRHWQRDCASELVAGHGLIVAEYFDAGCSRRRGWRQRPQAAALLAALPDPHRGFDAIVVGEYERAFSANQLQHLAPLLEQHGVQLWPATTGLPAATCSPACCAAHHAAEDWNPTGSTSVRATDAAKATPAPNSPPTADARCSTSGKTTSSRD